MAILGIRGLCGIGVSKIGSMFDIQHSTFKV